MSSLPLPLRNPPSLSRATHGLLLHHHHYCHTGLSLRDFRLDTSKWQLQDGPYELSQLSLGSAELAWPSWQDPVLRVRVSGVKLEILQRCMAKVWGRL